MIAVAFQSNFESWRDKARDLLAARVKPEDVLWHGEAIPCLFGDNHPAETQPPAKVPRDFLQLADLVSCHRSERKWPLLYRVLFRLTGDEPYLLKVETDPDVYAMLAMRRQVTHDLHRMHAFVRFREQNGQFVAWHRPDHLIVEKGAPWFAERFANMRWSILTPDRCAHWDGAELRYTEGVPQSAAPAEDPEEDLWRAYYAATFNPARLNADLCRQHMPKRYWAALPEAPIIAALTKTAPARAETMQLTPATYVPTGASLPMLRDAIDECRACDLCGSATQVVFGEGPVNAPIMLVGEQPGDEEDRTGRPFVGPAGRILDQALAAAGLDRDTLYVTSAVKHFRFEERGKRRIHKTASRGQIAACQPWLEAQMAAVNPKLLVCMGNTAVLSVIGRTVRLLEERGGVLPHRHAGLGALITIHPSFVLRQPEHFETLVGDLRTAARLVA